MSENSKNQRRDVYSIITDRIIEQLEKGVAPWKKPWAEAGLPQNLVTKRPYRGINVWLLSMLGYPHNYFLTQKQLKEFEGVVKEGEKGAPVTFWNWKEVADEQSGESKNVPFLRYYTVYNIDQCEGIPQAMLPEVIERDINPVKACDEIIEGMPKKPLIKHKEQKAYYNPLLDVVNVPKMNTFKNSESYYDTLFHELVHSTGHLSRLNRKELMQMAEFGSEPYSIEELIAEMGTCYLKSLSGFDGKDSLKENAAYIQGWLKTLKNDNRFVIYASGKAQGAVDFILNLQTKEKEAEHEGEKTPENVF